MKHKNPSYKRAKNAYSLEVVCGYCKTPILIYAKGGNGNLIKIQKHRIIESEFDLKTHKGHLYCQSCGEQLANRGVYNSRLAYFIIRGKINIKRLSNYKL